MYERTTYTFFNNNRQEIVSVEGRCFALTIKKAIIPAAGLGTRFLPATKAMPKEMLPIVDKPTIQYIVEEAIESGIEDIIIVTGKGKRAIEDHFDHAVELEDNLIKKGKLELLEKVKQSSKVEIHYIRQKEPMGLGHAVWCARKFIGDEPFAVLLGDDIVRAEKPCLKQLIEQYEETKSSIVGVQAVPDEETHRYGIIDPTEQNEALHHVRQFIEKPKQGDAPSNLAIMGRYILTPKIMEILENQELGAGNEVQLTDAIQKLNEFENVFAYEFAGRRYDVGEKLGFIKTSIELALEQDELRDDLITFIDELVESYKHNNY
ncbi:UTP--glucose-1-phosphate uridylyltransferase GalU [Pontibacillus yanchengensis]|uniref:UTP--glucose-1-phosphate uridylyltransferase GalU n=1 Tax=Pontibacillus yanchengensis TaxID=462910 RepID=A0ACC7VG88_9BACI|nr:UTP--glucose-1-phosphate uridylyltransferase GalU [Pontibacillus yanchengensis]